MSHYWWSCCFPGRAWQGWARWLQRRWRPSWTRSELHTHVQGLLEGLTLTVTHTVSWQDPYSMSHVTCFWSYRSFHLPGTQRTERNQRSSGRQRPDGGEGACGRQRGGETDVSNASYSLAAMRFLGIFGWICKCFSLFQGDDGVQGNGTAGCHGFQVCVNSSSCMSCTHDTVFWRFMSFFFRVILGPAVTLVSR